MSEITVLPQPQVALNQTPDNWRQMQPGRRRSLAQILEMQAVLYDKITNGNASLAEKAQATRAWDVLEDRKRELRGKPKAGMLRPMPRKRTKVAALPPPTESA